jgi:hypothetical protein
MIENWLNENIYGYQDLSDDEKTAIMHFSMLWGFFENYVLDTSASANTIHEKMTLWENQGCLNITDFQSHKAYFVQRYIENGLTNEKFDDLHLRENDKKDLVRSVLEGCVNDNGSILTALLIIVLRFRNNLFHGLKWEYGLRNQLSNFNEANSLLIKIIELQ